MTTPRVEVIGYRPGLAADFARLNFAWIERFFSIEAEDEKALGDPYAYVIEPGGEIFFVLLDGVPVGTVAMIPHGPGDFELAKMAVEPGYQGLGLGRKLMDVCIGFAEQRGAREIMLVTNDSLDAAVGLYRSSGFTKVETYSDQRYVRGNLQMRRIVGGAGQVPIAIE